MMIETMKFLLASLARMSQNERVSIMQCVGNNFCTHCGHMSEPILSKGLGMTICSACEKTRAPMQALIGGRGNKAVVGFSGKPHSMLFDTWTEALAWCDKEGIEVFNREAADVLAAMEHDPIQCAKDTPGDMREKTEDDAYGKDDNSQSDDDVPHWKPE